jgi:hypothetical protein
MEKEFVTYELALKMKQLGFDEPCLGFYNKEDRPNLGYCTNSFQDDTTLEIKCTAPLYQQAFRWFREKYKLHSTITSISQESWQWHITKPGESLGKLYDEDFYTYEEAELACLEKLIEIVEQKNEN